MRRRGALRCLIAAALFGATVPAASVLVTEMPPLTMAGLLYLGAAVAVAPTVISRPWPGAALRRGWWPVSLAVVAGGAAGPALLVAGLARIDAASASILLNLELVATVALAATVFREHLGLRVIMGAALVAAGGVVLVWQPDARLTGGALFIAAACLCWGIDNCVTARIDQISPEHVVLLKGCVAGSVNLMSGLLVAGEGSGAGPMLTAGPVAAVVAVGLFGYGVSMTQWVKGARMLGAARGQIIFASAPFIGAAVAWFVLREPVTVRPAVAAALAAGGVLVSLETAHEHRHRHHRLVHNHEHTHDDDHHDHAHEDGFTGRHAHEHEHADTEHVHAHVPDLHHRHAHRRRVLRRPGAALAR